MNIATKVKRTVNEVNNDLVRVSFIALLTRTQKSSFFAIFCFRFDLILSIITIVSLTEYHRTVSIAVMKNVSTLNSGKKKEVIR